jgi:two-component system OmpR family response regulator
MADLTSIKATVSRVLLVFDDPREVEFLKAFMERNQMYVDVARDAGQARAAFHMHPPDFVLCEAILPSGVSGFELCERLKQGNIHIPVIMLTEIDMDDARDLAKRVGADDYMTRPYDPEELLARIQEVAEAVWKRKHFGDSDTDDAKINFNCTDCGKKLRVKSSHRGRTLNCPRCGQPVSVPFHH